MTAVAGLGIPFGRLAHQQQQQQRPLAGNGPPWCDRPCDGRPPTGPYTGISHVHHRCWNCDREVLTRAEYSYDCGYCGVGAGPASVTRPGQEFDEEFAATHSSPA